MSPVVDVRVTDGPDRRDDGDGEREERGRTEEKQIRTDLMEEEETRQKKWKDVGKTKQGGVVR